MVGTDHIKWLTAIEIVRDCAVVQHQVYIVLSTDCSRCQSLECAVRQLPNEILGMAVITSNVNQRVFAREVSEDGIFDVYISRTVDREGFSTS